MEAASLLPNVAVLGASAPQGAKTGQVTQGGEAAGSVFGELVTKLLEQGDSKNEVGEVRAGQQTQGQSKEDGKTGGTAAGVDAIVQAQCLLGSIGAVQNTPDKAVLKYDSVPTESVDIASTQAATVSAKPTGLVPEITKTPTETPSQSGGSKVETALTSPAAQQASSAQAEAASAVAVPAQAGAETIKQAKQQADADVKQSSSDSVKTKSAGKETSKQAKTAEYAPLPLEAIQQTETTKKSNQVSAKNEIPTVRTTTQSASDAVKSALAGELGAGLTSNDGHTAVSSKTDKDTNTRAVAGATGQSKSKYATLFNLGQGQSSQAARSVKPVAQVPGATSTLQVGNNSAKNRVFDLPAAKKVDVPQQKPVGIDDQSSWVQPTNSFGNFKAVDAVSKSQGQIPPDNVTGAKMIHQIVKAAKVNLTETGGNMTLRLDPPHLGTVHMNVSVVEGSVTASIRTTTESARQVLQADLATLKENLASSGIHVDKINVTVGGDQNQTWQQSNSGGQGSPTQSRSHGGNWDAHASQGAEVSPEPLMTAGSMNSSGLNFLA